MATTSEDLTVGTVAITESENAVDGKYLLIQVPDFAIDPSGDPDGVVAPARFGEGMTSFLRLGAASTVTEPGDDLVKYAYVPGGGPVGFTGETGLVDEKGEPLLSAFIDDERNRGAGGAEPREAAGHGMTPEQRYNWHTKHLETKGGWRDHSDGNRISTTYGDKIEVIRGNYKLVVMGRQDDPGNAQGHEWSGNHVQDWGQGTMPGASVTLEWIQNGYVPGGQLTNSEGDTYDGGAWLLVNSTERVYQYSRNAGNFREQGWGDKHENYVGSENPERIGTTDDVGYQGHPTAAEIAAAHDVLDDDDLVEKLRPSSFGLPRGNPHIIEKTWAESIDSATGSAAWKIPQINETTWAVSMTDSTTAETITSTTKVETMTETTTAGSIVSTTYAGAIVDTTIAGMVVSTTIAPLVDLYLGLRLSVDLSAAIEITTGYKVELNLNHKSFFSPVEDEIAPLKTSVNALKEQVSITSKIATGAHMELAATSQLLATTRTELATTSTSVANLQMQMGGIKIESFNVIFLG